MQTATTTSALYIDSTLAAYAKTGRGTVDNLQHTNTYTINNEIIIVHNHFDETYSLVDRVKALARERYHAKNLATDRKKCYNIDDNTAVLDSNKERTVTT